MKLIGNQDDSRPMYEDLNGVTTQESDESGVDAYDEDTRVEISPHSDKTEPVRTEDGASSSITSSLVHSETLEIETQRCEIRATEVSGDDILSLSDEDIVNDNFVVDLDQRSEEEHQTSNERVNDSK